MGNRGVLHDGSKRVVASWRLQRWITCVLEWKGRRREVFAPNRYSELFFLDEATSLAAGTGLRRCRRALRRVPRRLGCRDARARCAAAVSRGRRDRSRPARGAAGSQGKQEDVPRGAVLSARRDHGGARGRSVPDLAPEAAALELRRLRCGSQRRDRRGSEGPHAALDRRRDPRGLRAAGRRVLTPAPVLTGKRSSRETPPSGRAYWGSRGNRAAERPDSRR